MKNKIIYFISLSSDDHSHHIFRGIITEDYGSWYEVNDIISMDISNLSCSHRVDANYAYETYEEASMVFIKMNLKQKMKKVYEWIFRNSPRLGWRVSDRLLTEDEAKQYFEENVLLGGMYAKKSEIGIIVEE